MIPAVSYSQMLKTLDEGLRRHYKRRDVNLTGILFARPESEFAQKEVLPHIDYWHNRSDRYTDFFCPGYEQWRPKRGSIATVVTTVGGSHWSFSNEALTSFLNQFEDNTSWRYRGGCELVVTNVRRDHKTTSLDLSSALAIDLEQAHREKAFQNVTRLCEAIFAFAKNLNEDASDPCWEFSDEQGLRIVKGSLKDFLLAYLPKSLKPGARNAFHFVAKDLRPPRTRASSKASSRKGK
jgi:hypothetical protein